LLQLPNPLPTPLRISQVTLSGIEFIHRFLQHFLPPGATKVRYYGIFSHL